jgi:hypothetical protein
MYKVIVERPRTYAGCRKRKGPGYPRQRLLRRAGDATKEAMGGCYRGKRLNENLAPLQRYLQKQVGRPWNKVRSEMAANLRVTSAVQQHVLDHVGDYVEEHVLLDEHGTPHVRYWGELRPLRARRHKYAPLWVCPKTGLLRVLDRHERIASDPHVHKVKEHLYWVRRGSEWFEVHTTNLPDYALRKDCFDAFVGAYVGTPTYRKRLRGFVPPWEAKQYARVCRLLRKEERRRYFAGARG